MNMRFMVYGAQGSVHWEALQWAQAVDLLVPLILTNRLRTQIAFLAGKGRMKSASEKDFHYFYQTAPSSEGGH